MIETISHALGYRPYLPKGHKHHHITDKKVKIRIAGEDLRNHVSGVLVPKLRDWIPKQEIASIKKNPQGIEILFIFKNGSTIELMSYEQGSEKFEGWDGDIVWFDEPPPHSIYIACWRGLVDHGGRMFFTMTPLKEPWIKEKLWDKRKDPENDIDGFVFSTYDNLGYGLTKKNVAAFERSLSEDEKTARIEGQFLHLTGRVYKEFDYNFHAVDDFEIPLDWQIYEAIDPHPRTPHAVLWTAVAPDETKYVVNELFKSGFIKEIAQMIKAKRCFEYKHDRTPRKIRATLIDPAAVNPDPVAGITVLTEFQRNGIFPIKARRDLVAGIDRIKQALRPQFDKSELYVFKSCQETLREFENYVWDEYKGRTREEKEPKNSPRDKDDHMLENLYRILLFNPKYRRPAKQASYEERYS